MTRKSQDRTSPYSADKNTFTLEFNKHRYDPLIRCVVSPDGKQTRLRAKSQKVLEYLADHANAVVSRDDLISHVWQNTIVTDDSLNKCISDVRKAIGDKDRTVLETVSRQGYLLHATKTIGGGKSENALSIDSDGNAVSSKHVFISRPATVIAGFCIVGLTIFFLAQHWQVSPRETAVTPQSAAKHLSGSLDVGILFVGDDELQSDGLEKLLIASLSRYSALNPKSSDGAEDYRVEFSFIGENQQPESVSVQVFSGLDDQSILTDIVEVNDRLTSTVERIAALIGSPAGGAIGRHLLTSSRNTPLEQLTRPQCLAYGYGCTTCSGEFDTVTPRAIDCLANLLQNNPNDADAWALQSTVYARQYLWGSALNEPLRSNQSQRTHLKHFAVEAATKAESLSDGDNPSVYWGMTQAYLASCEADKLHESVRRGLTINANDPAYLGIFGNFTAYTGNWQDGVELVNRAIALDPKRAKKWWYFALAKNHYRTGEYDEAYQLFLRAFDERNWLSHLQLAYTLPHLGRHAEANDALQSFMRVAPGYTLEHVIEFYKSYCFDEQYIARMQDALISIGMPSRVNSSGSSLITPVGAQVININNRPLEYIDVGDGKPVIFVHGSISDYRSWGYMMLPVSEKHRFISYSLRHFGTQPWPKEDVAFDFLEDEKELIEFIEHIGDKPVVLVGWSRGVQPAVMVARSRPDLVAQLVLYEGTITGLDAEKGPVITESEGKKKHVARMQAALQEEKYQEAIKPFWEVALQHPAGTFELQPTALQRIVTDNSRTLRQFTGEPPVAKQPDFNCAYYRTVKTPALVIHGEKTDPWWQYESESMAGCMPNAELQVLKDATHDGPLSQPVALTKLISDFLSSRN